MDYSSYSHQDDQESQQYHRNHHHHHQQQQQEFYDSSQFQPYGHSSQSYYPYNTHNHHYPYYHSYTQHTQNQFHQEPTSIHPPGVPIPPETAPSTGSEQTHLENQQQLGPGLGSDPNSGLNSAAAAAVAALSQLNQFAVSMDAAQIPMHPPVRAFNCFLLLFCVAVLKINNP